MTAARILKGQLHHSPGEETRLEMDKFPHVALSKVSAGPSPLSPSRPPLSLQPAGKGPGKAASPPGSPGPTVSGEQLLPKTLF